MHERGVAFGTAFVDLFATAIYGHDLAPGDEEVIADRFIADVADLRVKFARDGLSQHRSTCGPVARSRASWATLRH